MGSVNGIHLRPAPLVSIGVRLPPGHVVTIDFLAESGDATRQDVVRQAVEEFLERHTATHKESA